MPVSVTIDYAAVDQLVDGYFEQLHDAADYMAQKVRANLSVPGPEASAPGQYPHLQSGELRASIAVYVDRGSLTCEVVAEAEHAPYVEAARPFLQRTLDEEGDEVLRIATER
jgi:hypothetical protein